MGVLDDCQGPPSGIPSDNGYRLSYCYRVKIMDSMGRKIVAVKSERGVHVVVFLDGMVYDLLRHGAEGYAPADAQSSY